jgi:hypothetical protein
MPSPRRRMVPFDCLPRRPLTCSSISRWCWQIRSVCTKPPLPANRFKRKSVSCPAVLVAAGGSLDCGACSPCSSSRRSVGC